MIDDVECASCAALAEIAPTARVYRDPAAGGALVLVAPDNKEPLPEGLIELVPAVSEEDSA